ncbi:MAG: hypothetical protein K8S27_07490 [Candidatus Omnitrophica bacterium]|nr:hypothetical protein [Candidatus Omnitrophota bacterium]
MGDRFLFIMLIFFVITAAFVYDRYMIESKGVSPISQFIDFAGLTKINNWDGDVSDVVQMRRKYKINVEDSFFKIESKHTDMVNQKDELIETRRQILQQLTNINEDLKEFALPYLRILENEKKEVLKNLPQSSDFGQFLVDLHKLGTKDERLDIYQQEKIRLLNRYHELFEEENPELEKLKILFKKVEGIAIAHEPPEPYGCRAVDQCLRKNAISIEKELSLLFRRYLMRPKKNMKDLIDKVRVLNYENTLLLSNFKATEDKMDTNYYRIENRFEEIIAKISNLSEQEVIDLVAYYDSLDQEQSYLVRNLLANLKRMQTTYPRTYKDMKHLLDLCEYYSNEDLNDFISEFNQIKNQTKELVKKLKANEDQMLFLIDEQKYDYENLLDKIIKQVGVYEVSDQQKQIAKKRSAIIRKDAVGSTSQNARVLAKDVSGAIQRQRDRQRDLNRDFQRLRERVREQGY